MSFLTNSILANSETGKYSLGYMQNERKRVNDQAVLLGNAAITDLAYQEMDKQILHYATRVEGGKIVEDLNSLITPISPGKTLYSYTKSKGMDVTGAVTMDGNAPITYDHVSYDSDGDPVPIITHGYGVNWRHKAGLDTVQVDIILDSQREKSTHHNQRIADLTLNGDENIVVDGKPAQGLKNHRNTMKVPMGASGINVDLTTASLEEMGQFSKELAVILDNNMIEALDVLWVSPEIYANFTAKMATQGGNFGDLGATKLDYLGTSLPVRTVDGVRKDYSLKGNEWLGYVRDKMYIEIPVCLATTIIPKERENMFSNWNFMIATGRGVQVKSDYKQRTGVFYGFPEE